MKYKPKLIFSILISTLVTTNYTACSRYKFKANGPPPAVSDNSNLNGNPNMSDNPDSTTESGVAINEEPLQLGQKLYAINCAVCHGPLVSSTKLGKSATSILNAFKTISSMTQFSKFTSEQATQISLALNPNSFGLSEDSGVQIRVLISNRYLMAADLKELFIDSTSPDSNDDSIQAILNTIVLDHPEGFGGNCSRNDPGCVVQPCAFDSLCRGKLSTSQNAEVNPSASAVRKGYMIQSCEKILSIDKAVQTLAHKASVDITKTPNLISITTLARFMSRDRQQDSATTALNQLLNIASTSKDAGQTITDQWRFVILALCQSTTLDLI